MAPPRVIVATGVEQSAGLATVRALREGGFEPWAGVTSSEAAACASASNVVEGCVSIPEPGDDEQGCVTVLADAARRLDAAVVLPGTERALIALAEHADEFDFSTRVGAPAPELVHAALDKEHVGRVAVEAGLRIPDTHLVNADDSVDDGDLRFPAIVKPTRSELRAGATVRRFGARRVIDRDELMSAVAALPDRAGLVQPYLEGPLVTVNGVAWDGEVVISVHKRATRTWPIHCGPVCRAVTVPADQSLDSAVRQLIRRIELSGLFNLQFIDTPGDAYLIDLNPRPYHSLALAVSAGANLPAIYTSLLLDRPPTVEGYRPGVRFRSVHDLRATRALLWSGEYASAFEDPVPLRRVVCPVFSLRDPKPVVAWLARWLRARARRLLQSMSNNRRSTRSAT